MSQLCAPIRGSMVALLMAVIGISAAAAAAEDYQQLIKQDGPALVPIKFVLKISAGGEERESSGETVGVMIDDKGLVVCSNTQLGGFVRFLRTKVGAISAVPSDLKVLVGNDTEGVPATFLARDTELDLAWLRIKKPADMPYQYIDLSKSVVPKIGEHLLALRRMSKYFDRSPTVTEVHVDGITQKPRELYIPSQGLASSLGSPVFDAQGRLVGFAVLQASEESDNSQAAIQEGAGMILPASEVLKATRRALEQATTQPAPTQPGTAMPHAVPVPTTQPSR